jgi:glycosyltransferase involved in cell wall biosynthesis
MSLPRVLVASHGHPRLTNGGSEVAAYRLFTELRYSGRVQTWFLGCDPSPGAGRDGVAITQPHTQDEFLYASHGQFDWLKFANRDPRLPGEFTELLDALQPDVVHLHHYCVFGVEVLRLIRSTLPNARIVLTLHEFLAICHHYGQMVKTDDYALCHASGPEPCHRCFPDIDASDFFLRRRYIELFFDLVDHFICPSEFLAARYADWGIAPSRLSVIENITAPSSLPPAAEAGDRAAGQPLRVGFFGQISRLKGIAVVLECARMLATDPDLRIVFDIFGDHKNQPKPFQDEFLALLAGAGATVHFHGAYRQDHVDRLMRSVDAVLVPSIWWENSPVVIEEAMRNNRPVICSDIGGMAEKVRDGIDGFHFRHGSPQELGYLLRSLHDDPSLLAGVRRSMRLPVPVEALVAKHLASYKEAVVF